MNLSDLTSTGDKPWLTIVAESLDCSLGFGVSTGIVNFENLPLSLSPLPDHTIVYCDSLNDGRLTVNNGVDVNAVAYSSEVPVPAQLSSSVIFRQGDVSDGNVYGTWQEISDLIVAKEGLLDVYVDDSIVSPCVVSSSVDCQHKTNFFGSSSIPLPKLEISGGFALANPKSFNTLELQLVSPALPNIILTTGSIMSVVNGAALVSVDSTVPNISYPDGASVILSFGAGSQVNNAGNVLLRLGVGSSLTLAVIENVGNLMLNNVFDSVDVSSSLTLVYDDSFNLSNFNNPGFLGTLTQLPISVASSVGYDDSTLPSYGSDNVQGVLDVIKGVLTFGPSTLESSLPLEVPSNQSAANPDIQWTDSSNTGLYSSSTGSVDVSCGGSNIVHVDSTGMGIGTLVPTSKLHLVGAPSLTFKMVDGSQANNYVMISNAAGDATWLDPNALPYYNGFLYYEPAVGVSTSFPFGVMGTKYLIGPLSNSGTGVGFQVPLPGRIEYLGTPTRFFQCNIVISYANDAGLFEQQIYFWPSKNGVPILGSSTTQKTGLITTDFISTSMSFTVQLATNDYIELYASNESDSSGIKVHSLQISCA